MGRIHPDRLVIAGMAIVGAVAGLAVGWTGEPPVGPPPSTGEREESLDAPMVPVHVSGWVAAPGVVWVGEGSLASEAVEAAGGALPGARLDLINLAGTVHEGDQLQVPGPDAAAPSSGGPSADGLVDINSGDTSELERLPGVGPVLAGRIIAHRESVGRFEAVDDLLDVPGIGEATLASMRDLIRPP